MHFMHPIFTLTWKCPEFVQQLCRFLLAGIPLTYRYRLRRLGSLEERSHTSVPRPGRGRIGDQYGSHEGMGDHFIGCDLSALACIHNCGKRPGRPHKAQFPLSPYKLAVTQDNVCTDILWRLADILRHVSF